MVQCRSRQPRKVFVMSILLIVWIAFAVASACTHAITATAIRQGAMSNDLHRHRRRGLCAGDTGDAEATRELLLK